MNENSESFSEKKTSIFKNSKQPRVQRRGRARVGHDGVCSTTHLLVSGFFNFPRTEKSMDPNASECFSLRPARYHATESKRALVGV